MLTCQNTNVFCAWLFMKKLIVFSIVLSICACDCAGWQFRSMHKQKQTTCCASSMNVILSAIHGNFDLFVNSMLKMVFHNIIPYEKGCYMAKKVWKQLAAISDMQINGIVSLTQ